MNNVFCTSTKLANHSPLSEHWSASKAASKERATTGCSEQMTVDPKGSQLVALKVAMWGPCLAVSKADCSDVPLAVYWDATRAQPKDVSTVVSMAVQMGGSWALTWGAMREQNWV